MTTHTLPPEVKLDERALEAAMKAFIANPVARPENRGFPLRMAIMAYLSALEPSGEGVGAEPVAWQIWTGEEGDGWVTETERWHAEQAIREGTKVIPLYAQPLSGMEGVLREALEELVDSLTTSEHVPPRDPHYGDEVRRLGERIGFGALMASSSREWHDWLKANGYPIGSEFVSGPCRAVLQSDLRKARAALSTPVSAASPEGEDSRGADVDWSRVLISLRRALDERPPGMGTNYVTDLATAIVAVERLAASPFLQEKNRG